MFRLPNGEKNHPVTIKITELGLVQLNKVQLDLKNEGNTYIIKIAETLS